MTSTEKVQRLVDELLDSTDEQLQAMLPAAIPIPLARTLLAIAPSQVPEDPAELDQTIEQAHAFLSALHSDPEPQVIDASARGQLAAGE